MFDLLAGPPVRPTGLLPPVPFLFPFLLCTPRQDYRLRHHAFHGASARFHRPIRPQEKGGFHRAPLRWLCDSPSPSQIKVEVVSTIRSWAINLPKVRDKGWGRGEILRFGAAWHADIQAFMFVAQREDNSWVTIQNNLSDVKDGLDSRITIPASVLTQG